MDENANMIIGSVLRSWAAKCQPPSRTRAQLLWRAAHPEVKHKKHACMVIYPQIYQPVDWSRMLLSWDIHSFSGGLSGSRLLI